MTGPAARDPHQDPRRHRAHQHLPQRQRALRELPRGGGRGARGAARAGRGARGLRQGPPDHAGRLGGGHAQGRSCPREERTVTELAQQVEEGTLDALDDGPRRRPAARPARPRPREHARRRAPATWSPSPRPQGRLSPDGHAAAGDEVPRRGHRAQRPLRVRLARGRTSRWRRPSASSTEGDRASLVEVRIDDIYAVREAGARAILDDAGRGLPHHRLDRDEPEPLLRALAGEGRHRHHHRPHRDGGRAQHRGHPRS